MQDSVLTAVFLPLALAFIMLGMGLSLTLKDFRNIFVYPKAMMLGLANQLLLLPLFAFILINLFGLKGALAVGVMILAACPGGATSNLITHLCRGDLALSISLTAFSSFVTIISIPLIVNFSIIYFGQEGSVTLPVLQTIVQIMGVTLVPVSIGMWLNSKFPKLTQMADKPVRVASAALFGLVLIAAILKEKESILEFFILTGPIMLTLNILTLVGGYFLATLFLLPKRQRMTISIESGIQNGTLGIMIAATLLKNSEMTIPIAIYSLIMFLTALVVIFLSKRFYKTSEVQA